MHLAPAAFAVKKAQGSAPGEFLWRGGSRRAVVDLGEAAPARELRTEGKSLREIAVALAAEGHRPRGAR